jgi:phosphatidylglycerol:prolipoprotein diacylglycerol transferase
VRSTLLYIPHADPFWSIPVFGYGWLLMIVVMIGVAVIGRRVYRHGWSRTALADLPILLVFAAVVGWAAPLLEQPSSTGPPLGIPIRAYGVMVLLGISAGIMMSVQQARRMGVNPEVVFSICFWIIVAGFVGARTFYVVEYWEQFARPSFRETVLTIINLTDGGLVVYGGFIGASLACVCYVLNHQLPLLALADLLAPGLMIGLAFGRVGCLMNGCCWGGVCDQSIMGITFPPGSPPYIDQLDRGSLVGMRVQKEAASGDMVIREVTPGSLAERRGLKVGDVIAGLVLPNEEQFNRMRIGQTVSDASVSIQTRGGRTVTWQFGELPSRSRPVYPTQILSSINAALICLFLWAYYPLRRRDGEVFALLITIYPVTRILLEMIRTDESSVLSTNFRWTISQMISGLLLVLVAAMWWFILSRPRGSVLPPNRMTKLERMTNDE